MLSTFFGAGLFTATMYYVLFSHTAEKFSGFYNHTAFVLLLAGPLSVILMSRSFVEVFSAIRSVFSMTFLNQSKEMTRVANELSEMSLAVRNNGIGVLANFKGKVRNPLFRDGIALILHSFTNEEIKHNIIAKINTQQIKLSQAASLFDSLGKLSPGMGLLGTLVGLVQMLSNLSDPSKIGPGMAVSLLATLYGLVFGNVIYLPLAEKITLYAEKRLQLDTMIMEGVLLLKEKKSTAHFRDVVSTYSSKEVPMATGEGQTGTLNKGTQRAG